MTMVSILIPAYNAERWIGQTIESALNQTGGRREIIVVDDGSRDETIAVACRYASPELRVSWQANQEAFTPRSKALSFCQVDFIQWLDADDSFTQR